jgi:dipeptidyl aminopeptidase/acylaminoacyl peptidase
MPRTMPSSPHGVYLVRADGSSVLRLTDNGRPGYGVSESALAPDGRTVAYVESAVGAWSVRVSDTAGVTRIIDEGRCEFPPDLLAWSPDGRYLAVPCDPGVLIYSVADRTSTMLGLGGARGADRIGWDQDTGRVEAVIQGETLEVQAFDPVSGSQTILAKVSDRTDLTAIGFSNEGTRILLAGCPVAKPSDPSCYSTELDALDVDSGTLQTLWWGPGNETTNELISSARWRPDGTVVMNDPDGSGTLVIDPAGRSTHSAWPIAALLWLPTN